LASLTYLFDSGGSSWQEDGSVVGEEVQRLEASVRLLHLLVDDGSGPELMAPGEILSEVASLVRLQPGLERIPLHVQIPPEFPAIRMNPTLFLRSTLLLLSGAAEEAALRDQGAAGIEGVPSGGAFRIWPARGEGESPGAEPGKRGPLPPNMETLVAGVLAEVGGGLAPVRNPEGEVVLEFRVPDPAA
jgi:hypothetical protein